MTLIDPRVPIAALIDTLAIECGVPVSGARIAAALGPPLETALAEQGMNDGEIGPFAALFRRRYPTVIAATPALPGALQALRAVGARQGRTLIVTGKEAANAKLHVDALRLPVDALVGGLFAEQKAEALVEHGASIYVGDHVGDMIAARKADITAVAVSTGPCSATELREAGADVVLNSLTAFADWFSRAPDGGVGE